MSVSVEEREAADGGAGVRYEQVGQVGNDLPVVMLHGTGGSFERHFGGIAPVLSQDRHLIGVDFGPADSVAELAQQVESILPLREAHSIDLVGYSLGAVCAALVAARGHLNVRRLVLLCGWARTDSVQRARQGLWQRLHATDPEALRLMGTLFAYSPEFLRDLTPSELDGYVSRRRVDGTTLRQSEVNAAADIFDELADISASTLIIAGLRDQMVPLHHAQELQSGIPGSRLVGVRTGHAALAEDPARVSRLIREFVGGEPVEELSW